MKKKIVFIFVVLIMVLTACGAKSASTPSPAAVAPDMRTYGTGGVTNEAAPGLAPAPAADGFTGKSTTSTAVTQERMVTMTVDMSIVVADPQKKMDAINQMAKDLGGYLLSMNMSQVYTSNGETVPQGSISIRVPSTKLDDALSQIKTGVVDVPSENRSGQDVTSQYVDLQSQLTNLQKAEQDLQAIMDEAKNNSGNNTTTKTQDVLNVYSQIVSIRGQIEQITGQMKYIEETTSTSAINVTLIAEKTIQPITTSGWKPLVVANESAQSLVKFLQGFGDFLIRFAFFLVKVIVILLGPAVIALVIWGILALVRRRKEKKAAALAK